MFDHLFSPVILNDFHNEANLKLFIMSMQVLPHPFMVEIPGLCSFMPLYKQKIKMIQLLILQILLVNTCCNLIHQD